MALRVSVVINNCNYGRFLGQAIRSVLEQDYKGEVECVVVDDGSTDESRDVIASFGARVRAVLQPNQGQGGAFNSGFEKATGEIVCLLDSDDWWKPEKLRRVVERFEREPELGMVQHWCQEVSPGGSPLSSAFPAIPERYGAEDFAAGRCIFTGTTGLSFRAQVLRRMLPVPPELRICADNYLYYAVLRDPVGNIPEALAFRRVHGSNRYACRLANPALLEGHRRALAALRRELEKSMAGAGLRLSGELDRGMRFEEGMADLFLARYQGRVGDALRGWAAVAGVSSAKKAASLLLALASPPLYLNLQGAYARWRTAR